MMMEMRRIWKLRRSNIIVKRQKEKLSARAAAAAALEGDREAAEGRAADAAREAAALRARAARVPALEAAAADGDRAREELAAARRRAEALEEELERARVAGKEADGGQVAAAAAARAAQARARRWEEAGRRLAQFLQRLSREGYEDLSPPPAAAAGGAALAAGDDEAGGGDGAAAEGGGGEPSAQGAPLAAAWAGLRRLLLHAEGARGRALKGAADLEQARQMETLLREEKEELARRAQGDRQRAQAAEARAAAADAALREYEALLEESRVALRDYQPFLAALRQTLKVAEEELPAAAAAAPSSPGRGGGGSGAAAAERVEAAWPEELRAALGLARRLARFFQGWRKESGALFEQIEALKRAAKRQQTLAAETLKQAQGEAEAALATERGQLAARLAEERDKKKRLKAKVLELQEDCASLNETVEVQGTKLDMQEQALEETEGRLAECQGLFRSAAWLVALLARATRALCEFHEELRQQKAYLAMEFRRDQRMKEGVASLYEAVGTDADVLGMEDVFAAGPSTRRRKRVSMRAVVITVLAGNRVHKFWRRGVKRGRSARLWRGRADALPLGAPLENEAAAADPGEALRAAALPDLAELARQEPQRALQAVLGVFRAPEPEGGAAAARWRAGSTGGPPGEAHELVYLLERGQRRHWKTLQDRGIFEGGGGGGGGDPAGLLLHTSLNQTFASQLQQQGLNFTGSHHAGMDQIAAVRAAILKLLRQISIYEETLREFEAVRKQKDELEGAYLEERRLFEEKVTALHADIAKTEESLKDELKKRDTLNSDLSERADAMENNLTRERSENFRLQKELGRLTKELNQIKSGNKEEVEGLMKQLEDYCLERQALVDAQEKAEIAARVERTKQCPGCLDLRKGLSGLKDEIFKKDLDLGNADFRIGELTKQTELMQEESNRKGADLDKLRAAVAALEGERREARAKQEKMVREYAAALRDLEGLRVQAEAENREFAIQLDAEDQVRKSAEKASRPPENRSLFERNEFEDLHLRTNELLQSASVNGGLRSSASRQSQAGESDFRNGAGNGSGYHYQNQQPLVRPQQQH